MTSLRRFLNHLEERPAVSGYTGTKRPAFTGAYYDKEGLWQAADKGTLFLDEIGDLSLDHQVKVLRALEDGRIRKVGSEEEKKVDARIIAATNRDLPAMLRAGRFREELYYRLCGLQIYTPALREHPEDIPLLAEHFWKKIAGPQADPLPADILAELKHYPWPGNARLLRWVLVHLDRLFGRDAPRIEHLMAVLYYLGLAAPPS